MSNKRTGVFFGRVAFALLGLCWASSLWTYAQSAQEEDIHYRTAISTVTFSPDGKLAASTSGWIIAIWNAKDGEKVREIRRLTSEAPIVGVNFNGDGRLLYGGSADGTLLQWQVDTGKTVGTLLAKPDTSIPSYAYFVNAVAFSHDRKLFANGIHTGEVNVWEANTGTHLARLTGSHQEVKSMAFSPDGSFLAVGDSNDLILVWNLKEHGDPLVLRREATQDPTGWIYSTVFLPDGKSLTSSGFHPGVIVWNLSNSKESSLIGPNYDWVQSIDISPDGSYMLTGSKNTSDRDPNTHVPRSHRISLWSLKTATVLNEFAGSVAVFSPDGRRIAIADGQSVTFRSWK